MLMHFNRLDKVRCIYQALMSTGIQPSKALSQKLYIQSSLFQVHSIQIRNLKLISRRWFQTLGKFHNIIIIEVKSGDTIITLWFLRLLLDGNCLSIRIKLNNTKAFRIIHIISKHRSFFLLFRILYCRMQSFLKTMSGKNIVTKHHSNAVIADKFLADNKRLCKTVRACLYRIAQLYSKLMSVS